MAALLAWIQSNTLAVSTVVYLICDLLVLLVPSVKSNSILQLVLGYVAKKAGLPQPGTVEQTPTPPAK